MVQDEAETARCLYHCLYLKSFRCRLLNSSCASRAPFALCFGLLHDLADWEFPIVSTPTAPDSLDRTDVLRVTPWTPSPLSRLPRTARLLLFSSLQSPLFHDWPRAHDYTFLYNSDAVCLCTQRGFASGRRVPLDPALDAADSPAMRAPGHRRPLRDPDARPRTRRPALPTPARRSPTARSCSSATSPPAGRRSRCLLTTAIPLTSELPRRPASSTPT